MENQHTFYIIHLVDRDCDIGGRHLEKGYYRYVYDLTGTTELPNPCTYSKDRREWTACGLFHGLGEFQDFFEKVEPSPMKIEREDYVETITYRGISVPIFCDDYGQCFYCIMDNKAISFGSFQTEYEDETMALIDHKIDGIFVPNCKKQH